jgi:hypothetical protein
MDGINAASFDVAAKEAFAETTASGIDGVDANDISNVIAVDKSSFSVASSGSVKVTFTVSAVKENIPGDFADTASLVASIEQDMVELFDDPDTSESFVQLSVSKGSAMPADTEIVFGDLDVDESSIQETVVSTRSPTAATVINSNEGDDGTDVGTIVGITLGVLFGVIVLAFGVAYFVLKPKSIPSEVSASIDKTKSTTSNPLNFDEL